MARTLIAQFLEYSSWHLELIFTETAEQVWHYELDEPLPQNGARITLHSVSQLTDALAQLIHDQPVLAYAFEGRRYDCGSKIGYLEATVELGLQHPDVGAEFRTFLEQKAAELGLVK